jgi:RNA 3'-terminal phosphate cyclase (ATP)
VVEVCEGFLYTNCSVVPMLLDKTTNLSIGLKAQHVACIRYLADATAAKLIDCDVGSSSVEFWPTLLPPHLLKRDVKIVSDSVGSILLVFQALLPFLVMASSTENAPITLIIEGGTNVSFSPSFEYVDQVLLPALVRFGISVERKLDCRGWSQGSRQIGSIRFTIHPLPFGQTLRSPDWPSERGEITQIDVSMVVPAAMHDDMKKAFLVELSTVFPEVDVEVLLVEDSGHKARMYALLVAHTSTGLRFGRDWLYDKTSKNKSPKTLSIEMARGIVAGLDRTLCRGGLVDEHLQDQLIIFQTLAAGMSVIPGSLETLNSSRERVEKTDEPFGDGTKHTTTARWVTSQVLPTEVKWIDRGRVCHGVGWKNEPAEGAMEKSTGRIVT